MTNQQLQIIEKKMTEANAVENKNQYLTFNLGNELYGIEILKVKEILEYNQVTLVPMTPKYIRGVINLRGSVLPITDLLYLFENTLIEVTRKTCNIIIEVHSDENSYDIGMMVEAVNEVIEIAPEEIDPPPSFGTKIHVSCIKGMGKTLKGFVIILDTNLFLSLTELHEVAQRLGDKNKNTNSGIADESNLSS